MKVSTKLYVTTGVLLGVGMLLVGMGIFYTRSLSASLDQASHLRADQNSLIGDLRTSLWESIAELRMAGMYSLLKQPTEMETAITAAKSTQKRSGEEFAKLNTLLETEQGQKLLAKADAHIRDYNAFAETYIQAARDADAGRLQAAMAKIYPTVQALHEVMDQEEELQRGIMTSEAKAGGDLESQSAWANIFLSCLLVAVGVIAVFVVRGINRTLVGAITELSEGAEQVASAATQVSSSSQSLAQGASEQAASIEETSASSEEINSMSRKNSENSREAADLMMSTQKQIQEANVALDQSVVAMSEINTQSDKISKIIKTIDEIAFQTNILALNAAVEAARAGEAGMGFAVVADEVRNLAQRAAQAAKDTSALIEESITKSNDGKVKVDQVAAGIRAITEQAAKVKTLVDEVNLGSQEQTRGIEQIGKAITQMEQVTQKAAANAEESASAAEELNAQSETLKDIVERLTAMVGGGDSARGHAARPRRSIAPLAKGASPHHAAGPRNGLGALRAAVSQKPKTAEQPAFAGRDAGQDAFPLDEHFTEF